MEDYSKINGKLHNFNLLILFYFLFQATFWNQIDPVLRDCQFANLFLFVNTGTCGQLLTQRIKGLADFVNCCSHILV